MKHRFLGAVSLVGASAALVACTTEPDGGGEGEPKGWHAISLPDGQDTNGVHGVHCLSRTQCVIATLSSATGDSGAVLAATDTEVGEKLVDGGDDDLAALASVTGNLNFLGFVPTTDGVMARLDVSGAYVSATGDISRAGSWTAVSMGTAGGDSLPLNRQSQLRIERGGRAVFINKQGYVYGAAQPPGAGTAWTPWWAPQETPPVPADFPARYQADPTLCDADVTAGGAPEVGNPGWIAPDLNLIVLPAGGLQQAGSASPGVCISFGPGRVFHNVPFADLPTGVSAPGPRGVTCLDSNRCFAFNGVPDQRGTAYIQYTENAMAGVSSTWTAASVPEAWATSSTVALQAMFFAPDGVHGWVVGSDDRRALLVRTTDGGRTWADVSSALAGVTTAELLSGFALDADRIWIGGANGAFAATDTAQQ